MGRIVFAGGQVVTVDFDAVGIADRIKQHSNPDYVCNVQGSGQNAGASTSLDGGGWMPISVTEETSSSRSAPSRTSETRQVSRTPRTRRSSMFSLLVPS
jgi:hypothetical protein